MPRIKTAGKTSNAKISSIVWRWFVVGRLGGVFGSMVICIEVPLFKMLSILSNDFQPIVRTGIFNQFVS